jgi:forkhead transcription factor HCM1
LRAPFSNKLNMISMPPPGGATYNTDSIQKKQPLMSKFKPQKALFTTFTSSANDKENYSQPYYNQTPIAPYSDGLSRANFSLEGLYGQKPPAKRLMEAAPIHESRPFKRTKIEDGQEGEQVLNLGELPAPESFPLLHDDGTKPPHSYAQLIGMSILRAPSRRLTLAQIYKWISDTYSFYSASDAGWQNSIRHNLSLNKAFIKQERPKDDPGKGNYWAIQPGMEHQFIKDKSARKPAGPNENVAMLSTNLAPLSQPEPTQYKPLVPAPQELPPPQQTYSLPEPQLPSIRELSSDATIPASDAIVNDPELEEEAQLPEPSSPLIQSSPPTAMMHSSPPIPRYVPRRHDTPPPVPRFPSSSRSRSHKRKFASMDDSGYISSLDSSAIRPHRLLTSEADRPRIKRGRAEEEIARLRGSSYDSPTKGPRTSFIPPSSSPLRVARSNKNDNSQMLPPLTPALKLKPPTRPPPSVSPNTNLRLHRDKVREMVGSPLRDMTCLDEGIHWSPAFNLDDASYMFHDFGADFDIFADGGPVGLLSVPGNGSPEKKSAKRPRLDRSRSANILADISNTNFNKNITSTPLLKFTPSTNLTASVFDSPLKGLGLLDSPSHLLDIDSPTKIQITSPSFSIGAFDLPQEDAFYGAEFLAEDIGDSSGWDIMQGFQKIGSGNTGGNGGQSTRSTPKTGGSRPPMERSFTSRF